jgi:transcriptional regulator with XRE-family HTH domain
MTDTLLNSTEEIQPKGPNPADLAVGKRLRQLRHRAGRSLQDVAAATGLSIGLISQIERGLSSPSVKMLCALGDVLGVGLAWFFEEIPSDSSAEHNYIVRREMRAHLSMSQGGVQKDLLSPDATLPLQLFLIRVEPGGTTGEGLYAHSGESNGFVLSGQLLLRIEEERFLLREGDSFLVPANVQRWFSNPDNSRPTTLIWAVARGVAKARQTR